MKDMKLIQEAWERFKDSDDVVEESARTQLDEITRKAAINKANQDGAFIDHNRRTREEIDDGSFKLNNITPQGEMLFSIRPWDVDAYNKNRSAAKSPFGQSVGPVEPGTYELTVKFINWDEIMSNPQLSTKEKAQKLIKDPAKNPPDTDDILVNCTCPSARFHYAKVAKDAGIAIYGPMGPDGGVANPLSRGIVCKHARRLITQMPAFNFDLIRAIVGFDKDNADKGV